MTLPHSLNLVLSLVGLGATLAVAIVQPRWLPEAAVAIAVGAGLVAVGAVSVEGARHAVDRLAPTIGFLVALLLLADGCRREGLFRALGGVMARGSRGSPRRLLALVFAVASGVTVFLGLDPAIVLLTPVVLATATSLRISPKPDVYATVHLANSASLLLPVSNLTNLLVFNLSALSFIRFASMTLLPTLAAIGVEWVVLSRFFAAELGRPREAELATATPPLPRFALGVLGATLVGFLVSSPFGVQPVWVAAAGAAAITVPALVRRAQGAIDVVRALEPSFLLFVLGLGVIVVAASDNGLATAVRTVLPGGTTLPDLLGIAAISALAANLLNNLPAILIIGPVAARSGDPAVLAALVGVNVGPNLTYTGSLATLLWRRRLQVEDTDVNLGEFLRLGALTVPAALVASTLLLWSSVKVGL
jgi:arsenical pump membrane protein